MRRNCLDKWEIVYYVMYNDTYSDGGEKMATIKDVAKRAGLSTTLVSRYLNGQKGVSPASREKITAAIRELNYRPNGIARSLVRQETQSIGIVLDNICAPFMAPLITGLQRGAEEFDTENKYNVIFCSSDGDMEKKKRHIQFLTQGRVDGIIIYGSLTTDDELIRQLADTSFPFLLIENDIYGVEANKVVIDNVGGAYRATRYLIEHGYRRIAHIAGNMNLKITSDRLNGYIRALQDSQIPVDQNLILYPDFRSIRMKETGTGRQADMIYLEAGYREMKKLLEREELPEAVFFATDISAFGAMKAMEEAGLKVPEDIGMVGFDDEMPGDYGCVSQQITTMRQPLYEAGYLGIKNLIRSVKDPEHKKERVVLQTELIERKSCKFKKTDI